MKMGLPDAELKIVSLVRYIDACAPSHRHRDCPFAVERDGELHCHEECREVLSSVARRGRSPATASAQTFDARQLRLSEVGSTPAVLWHTSSLLQVLRAVARTAPFRPDGSPSLRRHIDATSALGALGCRGLDMDKLVRRGLANTFKLTLAGWLEGQARTGAPRGGSDMFNQWREFFEKDGIGDASPGRYISAAMYGQTARRLNAWLESADLDDILRWRWPESHVNPYPMESFDEEAELWTWVVERFTETYLENWSFTSLQCEYRYLRGGWIPDIPEEIMADRAETHERVAAALADRTLVREDVTDPATLSSLVYQSLSLIEDGQRREAAALWDAARRLRSNDLRALQNFGFCITIDEPSEARSVFTDVLARGITSPEIPLCNLALAELLLNDTEAALRTCEQAYAAASERSTAPLWVRSENGKWIAQQVSLRRWVVHLGTEIEKSLGRTQGVWAERLHHLQLIQLKSPSADPSTAETDEADL